MLQSEKFITYVFVVNFNDVTTQMDGKLFAVMHSL